MCMLFKIVVQLSCLMENTEVTPSYLSYGLRSKGMKENLGSVVNLDKLSLNLERGNRE